MQSTDWIQTSDCAAPCLYILHLYAAGRLAFIIGDGAAAGIKFILLVIVMSDHSPTPSAP